jgi:hypothetical protein
MLVLPRSRFTFCLIAVGRGGEARMIAKESAHRKLSASAPRKVLRVASGSSRRSFRPGFGCGPAATSRPRVFRRRRPAGTLRAEPRSASSAFAWAATSGASPSPSPATSRACTRTPACRWAFGTERRRDERPPSDYGFGLAATRSARRLVTTDARAAAAAVAIFRSGLGALATRSGFSIIRASARRSLCNRAPKLSR